MLLEDRSEDVVAAERQIKNLKTQLEVSQSVIRRLEADLQELHSSSHADVESEQDSSSKASCEHPAAVDGPKASDQGGLWLLPGEVSEVPCEGRAPGASPARRRARRRKPAQGGARGGKAAPAERAAAPRTGPRLRGLLRCHPASATLIFILLLTLVLLAVIIWHSLGSLPPPMARDADPADAAAANCSAEASGAGVPAAGTTEDASTHDAASTWQPPPVAAPAVHSVPQAESGAGDDRELQRFIASLGFATLNDRDEGGRSVLHLAAERGQAAAAEALLRSKAFSQANSLDAELGTALHAAAHAGHAEIARRLLRSRRFRLAGAVDKRSWTALHWAAVAGHASVVQALLSSRRFVKALHQDRRGATALHMAAFAGHRATAESLLGHPRFGAAAAGTLDRNGLSAVDYAVKQDNGEVAQWLRSRQPA